MSEKFPSKEGMREISREDVVAALRENPENLSFFNLYIKRKEGELKTSKDTLLVNMEIAEIYRDAGLLKAAQEAFTDAAAQAWNEYEDEIYQNIIAELDKLKSKIL